MKTNKQSNNEINAAALQIYWNNIQMNVPPEQWGFMAFLLTYDYIVGAFQRNVSVDMIVRMVDDEFNKAQSAALN